MSVATFFGAVAVLFIDTVVTGALVLTPVPAPGVSCIALCNACAAEDEERHAMNSPR